MATVLQSRDKPSASEPPGCGPPDPQKGRTPPAGPSPSPGASQAGRPAPNHLSTPRFVAPRA